MQKKALLYQGKAKNIYQTDQDDCYIMHYRDDATAFNGVKCASLSDKGKVNNTFNAFIMTELEKNGVKTHFVKQVSDNESVVKSLEMIPVECVVRNVAAGSITKRLGLNNGLRFEKPVFEFFYKDDALGDPMINESHILMMDLATKDEIEQMKILTFKVNDILKDLFSQAGIDLIDYKLEFGRFNGELLLGDEFTPDGCRLWDKQSAKIMDKDRFRQDLGDVIETYKEVAERLGIEI
ncbi:phosphoribosylaminoimidazolesuccinocarboxamide synthase [Thiotrichales bacterium 19S11-10]|nr:phosphoribosylaminoimidazolesuccinocarboxamide synthase [Thiotrichales bacterium 19S11-10]MCF6807596.1 phosphoribosylaminoimidazolesuccinocarboxamide synthase [Thiotrichales bacterium 19S9-11]MCF6811565.1 phosphoribosylaminoimidazolesuccinocarboxamide synthase [Thiotrichales bacterium 19S9-12]